jgi:nitrite reductase (NO-forming)
MKRFVLGGVFLELALLIIGLTWIHPAASSSAQTTAARSAREMPYKVDDANGNIVEVRLTATEAVQEIAPGIEYHVWTFDGTAPGPVIRVHLGDTVHFTLTNASTIGMQHSIDFHAAMTPWDKNYQPVDPGQTKTFDWVAMYPGVFMYHCGTPPVLQHISNGMYGAIIVEPNGLPAAREYVLVASEFYPGPKPIDGLYQGDYDAMVAAKPTYVVFNGVADQYKAAPLVARPNELIRLWVLDAGPTLTTAFHTIGAMFDSVYVDGNPTNVLHGVQTYNIPPGGGAMFELRIPEAGLYPFVTHAFAYTGLGSVGLLKVDPSAPAAPTSYPTMGDPFGAGTTSFQPPTGTSAGGGSTGSGGMSMGSGGMMGSGSGSSSGASCTPSGAQLSLVAMNTAFDTDCLAAPAGEPFTIDFQNKDPGVPHNVSIYTDPTATTALFTGEVVSGPASTTYEVPALKAGTYFFRCDVHPTTMTGTFVVK